MMAWLNALKAQTKTQTQASAPVGGIHPAYHKDLSTEQAVATLIPQAKQTLVIPLQQHSGQKPELLIKSGDYVFKGQKLADADGNISVPVHASTSGTITAIESHPIAHPSGLDDTCIILEADGNDERGDSGMPVFNDYTTAKANDLRRRICEAGIVGLGGAVFPSAIKLNIRPETPITTLVVNGAECEPYISCDDMLMRDKAEDIVAGIRIMLHIVREHNPNTVQCLIGVEDNKPDAIAAMQTACHGMDDVQVVPLATVYPTGGEKQLIQRLTGKEVPSGGRPADVGIICHNVATARAIYHAVSLGQPLTARYVTVTGAGVKSPRNLELPLGLPMHTAIEHAQGYTDDAGQLVMGGSMMGIALHSDAVPVVKATNCILVNAKINPEALQEDAMPCIRCGRCADACPASLVPQQLYWHSHAREFEQAEKWHLFDCIECGCCDYVCPSHIPLVDYYRFAKAEIRDQRVAKQKSELARERHDFRQERLERAKRERAEKLAKHKEALQKKKAKAGSNGADDAKKAAIQAAMQRAQAKKAAMTDKAKPAEKPEKSNKPSENRVSNPDE